MKVLALLLAVCVSGCAVSQQTIAERRWESSLEAYDSPYNDLEDMQYIALEHIKAEAVLNVMESEGK